jgi:electron transfer flavoprotein beta subunit
MRICVLVKEVPDATTRKRLDARTGRLERSGERALNPYDAHALEAALRLREQGLAAEVVAVTMGPPSAARTLHKAVSLGAERSVHLCDDAFAGSDLIGTGLALASALARERPDLVLLGQQSSDGECCALAPIVAEYLGAPALTQVIGLEIADGVARCVRQGDYGYDEIELALPAVIAVAEAIGEPRYPSLKAIMAARGRPVATLSAADLEIDPERIGAAGALARWRAAKQPPPRPAPTMITDLDSDATAAQIVAWLEERGLIA